MRKTICRMLWVVPMFVVLMFNSSASSAQTATVLASGTPLVDPIGVVESHDGEMLFITDYTANAVFSIPANGGTPTEIASGGPFINIRSITISPDGKTLFIAGWENGNIISLPAMGGTPTILASGYPLAKPHDVAVSPDGSTLYIADNLAGAVFSLPVTGGSPTILASGAPFGTGFYGPLSLFVSPDGSTLFISAGFAGLFSLPVTGGTPSLVAPLEPPIDFYGSLNLSANKTTFLIHNGGGGLPSRFNPGPTEIYSMPVGGGSPTLVYSGAPLVAGGELSLSNDGRILYVADTGYSDRYKFGPAGEPGRVISLSLDVQVLVDIKPGNYPNSIKLGSKGKVPVAILSTPDIDATAIDPSTVTLAEAPVSEKKNGQLMASVEDVNNDGYLDLIVHFETSDLDLTADDTSATLLGFGYDGTPIEGTDSVLIVQ